MKFLIWFFCFFCMAVVKMFIDGTDIAFLIANSMSPYDLDRRAILAGLIAGLIATALFSITWWCGKRLCRVWDRHISSKRKDPSVPKEITANTVVSSSSKKLRYCKLCGGTVDPDTKVCGKCGKQYFRLLPNKLRPVWIIGILSGIAISLCLFQHVQYHQSVNQLQAEVDKLTGIVSELNNTIDKLTSDNADKQRRIQVLSAESKRYLNEKIDLQQDLSFYEEHVVFVPDDGYRMYHKYGCFMFDDSYFWAYNTEKAEQLGYSPCWICCK